MQEKNNHPASNYATMKKTLMTHEALMLADYNWTVTFENRVIFLFISISMANPVYFDIIHNLPSFHKTHSGINSSFQNSADSENYEKCFHIKFISFS